LPKKLDRVGRRLTIFWQVTFNIGHHAMRQSMLTTAPLLANP
jgi:hypothetical protein